jgi:hypothetical protein
MIRQRWKLAFHGTRQDNIKSILECGLLKSGSATPEGDKIEPPRGHIELGTTLSGIENWAGAVFASPSILYASERAYSEWIEGLDGSKWCCVIKVLVNPLCFDTHVSTTTRRIPPVRGEPNGIEYRCRESNVRTELSEEWGRRGITQHESLNDNDSEASRNVAVKSVLFVKLDFLRTASERNLTHETICGWFSR